MRLGDSSEDRAWPPCRSRAAAACILLGRNISSPRRFPAPTTPRPPNAPPAARILSAASLSSRNSLLPSQAFFAPSAIGIGIPAKPAFPDPDNGAAPGSGTVEKDVEHWIAAAKKHHQAEDVLFFFVVVVGVVRILNLERPQHLPIVT